jgi:hypothetical protein
VVVSASHTLQPASPPSEFLYQYTAQKWNPLRRVVLQENARSSVRFEAQKGPDVWLNLNLCYHMGYGSEPLTVAFFLGFLGGIELPP